MYNRRGGISGLRDDTVCTCELSEVGSLPYARLGVPLFSKYRHYAHTHNDFEGERRPAPYSSLQFDRLFHKADEPIQYDKVVERLRWIRNPLSSARRSSNPVGAVLPHSFPRTEEVRADDPATIQALAGIPTLA